MSYPNSTPPREAMIEAKTTYTDPQPFLGGIPSSSTGGQRRWHSRSSILVDFKERSSSESELLWPPSLLRRTSERHNKQKSIIIYLNSFFHNTSFFSNNNEEIISSKCILVCCSRAEQQIFKNYKIFTVSVINTTYFPYFVYISPFIRA